MYQIFLYLHVLGAVLLGVYILLPALVLYIQLDEKSQHLYLRLLSKLNRLGQFALILTFLTGGYLVSQAEYPTIWWLLAIVLLVGIAAVSGIMGSKIRKILKETDTAIKNKIGAIRSLSFAASVLYFLVLTLMLFPNFFE
ncbi:hypothetical protein BBD42_06925 [Paenibacillus sp. BIHB 4019]|uniref:DUF2269 domain-containing protein n=1 Tax=Paenibacillus sp. BIHB 4019 TaxID=1870819 RepID=A0A1B2DEV1_9BACL|nr:hypothetical protein [Paenibacillus sp. BIHB 4019]ANY66226.1 hypothetical protein BBD42_06925 [Paenibacillus sp. BIHB 4019]